MEEYGQSKTKIAELLVKNKIRPTQKRIEITYFLLLKPQHLRAEEIYQNNKKISLATIYNTLKLLTEKKLILKLFIDDKRVYYDSNTKHHYHYMDTQTDRIIDILPSQISIQIPPKFQIGSKNISLLLKK